MKHTHDGIAIAPRQRLVLLQPTSTLHSPAVDQMHPRSTDEASGSGTTLAAAHEPTPLDQVRDKLQALGIAVPPTFRFNIPAQRILNGANSPVRAENTRRLMSALLPAIASDPRLGRRGALEDLVKTLNDGLSNQPFYVASGHIGRALREARAQEPQAIRTTNGDRVVGGT